LTRFQNYLLISCTLWLASILALISNLLREFCRACFFYRKILLIN